MTRVLLSHEVDDKINVDSYRRAVRHLPAAVGGVVWSLARLGLDGDREEPRVPDLARDPADPRDGLRRVGRREGGVQSPVAARAFRVFPGADVPVPQRQRAHLRGGLQPARLRGPRPRRAGLSRTCEKARVGYSVRLAVQWNEAICL